jgi:hypothetical protein
MQKNAGAEKAPQKKSGKAVENSGTGADTPTAERGTLTSIPRDDKSLVQWGGNFYPWLDDKSVKANITAGRMTVLLGNFATYVTAVGNLEGGKKSELLVKQKDDAKAIVIADIEGLIEFELRNPEFSDAELLEGGIRVEKTVYEHDTQITIHPEPELASKEINEVEVKSRPEDAATGWFIPKGCQLLEWVGIVVDTAGTVIPDPADCPLHGQSSRSRLTIRLGPGHSGKRLVIYARYTNHYPNPGPWGGPHGVTIK